MSTAIDRLASAVADRYTVHEELGAGGMATVYLAEDLKHHRQVAVKVLRPELAAVVGPERFLREIEIAANLNHPHILPLFDSGEADEFLYYVMPYVEGESLRSRLNREKQLPLDDALHIAREVADALDYAHSQDVVHRDIKPENILLSRGHALVVDFGIGKALHAVGAEQLTQTGVSIGTPAYMSPEQAAGQQDLDGRSDLYALGCVLYEMLAGEPLFSGPTAQAIIAKHISEPVTSVLSRRSTVPANVDDALGRVLAKAPADRFSTGARFAEALAAPAASGRHPAPEPSPVSGAPEKSIAVLPFANISADPENEYFSDGITEEIINALAQLPELHVAARTSAFSFKGENIDLRTVGEKLNVATVLEGSVRKAGNRVRITAQLIDVADGYHLWSERYDRELDDIFAIQDEIASTIAEHLKVTLAGGSDQALVKPATDNLEAYELYLKGRFYLYQRVGASFQNALECVERAVALDPDYAQAHAGMAETYATLGFFGLRRPNEVMPKAKEEAMRALALDETLGAAHHSLALVKLLHEWDWAGAKREFRRALELDPGNAVIRSQYAFFIPQMLEGRHEQAMGDGRLALESDPLSAYPRAVVSLIMTVAGEHEEGIRLAQAAASNEPNSFMAHRCLGLAYSWPGKHEEAAAALERAVELSGRHQWPVGELLAEYAAQGRWAEAKVLMDELRERSEREYVYVQLAVGEALLGNMDTAFEALELAYTERDPTLVLAKYWPGFDPVRGDPRWDELLQRMDLK